MGRRRMARWVGLILAVFIALAMLPTAARAITGTHPLLIVLCNFKDQQVQPKLASYYEHMFSDAGAGELGALDYWNNVSLGNLSISGTVVKGWYTLDMTRDQWIALPRIAPVGSDSGKWNVCAEAAANDGVDYNNFAGVVTVYPEAAGYLAASIGTSDTSLTLQSTTAGDAPNFPTPSFQLILVQSGSTCNPTPPYGCEIEEVTAVKGTTFTVQRNTGGVPGGLSFPAGAYAYVPGDLFGFNPTTVTLAGNNYTLGGVVMPHDAPPSLAFHEMGHSFGFNHSRSLSQSTTDYNDCFDQMSTLACGDYGTFTPSGTFGGTVFGGNAFGGTDKGPGLNAIQLDTQGWIPGGRELSIGNGSCGWVSVPLHSLNDYAGAISGQGWLEARMPANISITNGTNSTTTGDYYTVEYREKAGWDAGIPQNSVLLHLHGQDGRSYWVQQGAGKFNSGLLVPGDEYVDAANKDYVAVNSEDAATHTAKISLGSCKIDANLDYSGDTSGDFNDQVTLAADLTVYPHAAPIPNANVTLTLGTQSCTAKTDANGHVSCSITLNQDPGSYTAGASFGGDATYNAKTSSGQSFTINKEESKVTYTGATTQDYHDPFIASATLTDPDGSAPIAGKQVVFTLGAGDSCTAATDAAGNASCSITPTQKPGTMNIVATFAGDADYLASSDSKPFVVTKEETTLTYTGPTVILQGAAGVTLKAQLYEDTSATPLPSGQTITLSLGSQSCTGTTNASGVATCSFTFSGALGSEPLKAAFAGDDYYLPSSDASKTAIVFAFPSPGAFVLGDRTAATAGSSTVTWWSDSWWQLNALSGGVAPSSFKGFAGVITLPTTTPPTSCGSAWTTSGGNSPPPASGVPSYMGVVVAGSVTKSGTTISGNSMHIVVVKINPGYAPNPMSAGTGTIVATFC